MSLGYVIKMHKKLIFIALDGFRVDIFKEMLEEDRLPNIKRVLDDGIYADLMPTYPAITTSSWTSMMTGAWPGTHGLIDFQLHFHGEPLDVLHNAFQPEYVQAETIWKAAEKAGRNVALIHFPGIRGAKMTAITKGVIIGGRILGRYTLGELGTFELAPSIIYTSKRIKLPDSRNKDRVIMIQQPKPLKDNEPAVLETCIHQKVENESLKFKIRISCEDGIFDKVSFLDKKNKKISTVKVGEWTKWIRVEVNNKTGIFRFKVLELSEDGKGISIFQTPITPLEDFTVPSNLAPEISDSVGPFPEEIEPPISPFREESKEIEGIEETYFELANYQAKWLFDVASYIISREKYDMIFTEFHEIDHTHHRVVGFLPIKDPSYKYLNKKNSDFNEAEAEKAEETIKKVCEIGDELVGNFLKIADDDTIIVVASDHGCVPAYTQINVNSALEEAGFLKVIKEGGRFKIDWRNTQAYHWERNFISINLKGREPTGVVEPEDYWDLREEVISALSTLENPMNNEKNLIMLFPKEECLPFGLYGERLGDIFLLFKPGYTAWPRLVLPPKSPIFQNYKTGAHTFFRPEILENRGIFIISGPGISKSEEIDYIRAVDVAPTLASLLEIPFPAQNQGRIIEEIIAQ